MTTRHTPSSRPARRAAAWSRRGLLALAVATLSACGGGGGDGGGDPNPPLSCSVFDRNVWLGSYMNEWYYWYAISPNPDPAGYSSLSSYFDARLYTGSSSTFPADRWSYYTPTADYDRFFGDGQTLGYGLMVAGLEVQDRPDLPLLVRYVEPGSPAALAGLARGDRILSLNGRSAADVIAADDFSALSATTSGQTLNLVVRNASGDRSLTLSAAVYALAPVNGTSVVTTAGGRKLGYVMVKDMIRQAVIPLDTAFAQFRTAGVSEVAIDLRYNGGGLVSTAASIASYPSANRTSGQTFASLLYNNKRQVNNTTFRFENPANALGLSKVYVLTGPRTCSASEQLINALRPFVTVVTIGDTTCGKPVGFLPQADGCGTTFSVVNFESVNASNEGRYFDGFNATCPVAEDFSAPLGSSADPLMAAAKEHADGLGCPVATDRPLALGARSSSTTRPRWQGEPGDRFGGMLGR